MSVKRTREKSLLSRQDIAVRRKQLGAKKRGSSGAGRRAIGGVFLLALSVLAFFSVATFDAHDRMGPGFRNAIGPVGHAVAEALRGLLGLCAYVLPVVGVYGASVLFVGDREKRRWPQVVALGLLLVSGAILFQLMFKEDASWAHAPGGLVGRALGGALTALFSTVGTVVLVSAVAVTAFIVGTEYAFLHFCAWAWARGQVYGARFWAWAQVAWEQQKANLEARKLEREKDKAEEAEFLAELEAEEAELDEAEALALEAEAAANEAARDDKAREDARLSAITERERLKAERERIAMEREATRLAREALKTARLQEKQNRSSTVAALAPTLINEARAQAPVVSQPPVSVPPPSTSSANANVSSPGEPAWARALNHAAPPPPPPAALQPAVSEAPPRRVPTIVAPLGQPPAPAESAVGALSVAAEHADQASGYDATVAAAGASALVAQASSTALATVGPSALSRMPLIVEPKAPPKPSKKAEAPRPQFEMADGRTGFELPPTDVLENHTHERSELDKDAFLETASKLTSKLKDFGIEGEVVEIRPGPVVTMYEFKPAPGVKVSKIASLSDDLAMAMEAMRVRIVAPIPGKGVVGVEVPNKKRESVFLREVAEQDVFQKSTSRLTMCLGKDIEGMPYILDLAKAPHMLMAGTTGSGKSVSVNSMIMSILLKATPEEVRFIMVDPKMLELSVYEGIPHLLLPVVTDPRKAAIALQWAVEEMTRRYKLMSDAGVRNLTGYNDLVMQEQKERKASQATVDARPTSIKPKQAAQAPRAEAAPVVEAKPEEPAGQTAEAAPAEPPRKKRRLLIVDVAEGTEGQTEAVAKTDAPGSDLVGVAAPVDEQENPLESAAPAIDVAAEVKAEQLAAEIRVEEAHLEGASEPEAQALADAADGQPAEKAQERVKLPYIVVIIDELADLMMVAAKEVETSIARLAQMARAAGIHLMVATQRPSTDVVTGLIKANFPTRISFMLRSKPDSMTILGQTGAEALLGMGDMLIQPPNSVHVQRAHGCFVSEAEIKRVVDHLKAQGKPVYDESILKPRDEEGSGEEGEEDELADELYDQAIAIVSEMKTVSISILQRKMRIGYNRSARMIERMERDGVVGAADGAKPREVLVRAVGQMPGAGMM